MIAYFNFSLSYYVISVSTLFNNIFFRLSTAVLR